MPGTPSGPGDTCRIRCTRDKSAKKYQNSARPTCHIATVPTEKLRKLLIPLILLAALGGLVVSLANKDRAPDVRFTGLDGRQTELSALRGKVVLINFWATTCPGCIAEMPALIETHRRYHARGLEIINVAMPYDPPAQVARYAEKNALPFTVALDPQGELTAAFGDVRLTPTAFLISPEGNIVRHVVGELDFPALHQYLEQTLRGAG